MMFTQCNIVNCDSRDEGENRNPFVRQRTEGIELYLSREQRFGIRH